MMTGLRSLTERLMVMSAGGGTISDEWRATAQLGSFKIMEYSLHSLFVLHARGREASAKGGVIHQIVITFSS